MTRKSSFCNVPECGSKLAIQSSTDKYGFPYRRISCAAGHQYCSVEIPESLFKKLRLATPTFQRVKKKKDEIRVALMAGNSLRSIEKELHTSSELILEVVHELEVQGARLRRVTKYAAKKTEAIELLTTTKLKHVEIASRIGTSKGFVTRCNQEVKKNKPPKLIVAPGNESMNAFTSMVSTIRKAT